MADGVAVTAGSGTTIATDDTGIGHVQINKLAVSADGDGTYIPATTDGLAVIIRPETAGGITTPFRSVDLDETEEAVKASAGAMFGYMYWNNSSSARYVKWYNATTANTTVGTTTPYLTMMVPASAAGHVAFPHGVPFSTAITVAATTGPTDGDTGAPGANEVGINVFYK